MIFDLPTTHAPEVADAIIRLTAEDGSTIERPCGLGRRSIAVQIPVASSSLRIEFVRKAADGSDWTPMLLAEVPPQQTTCTPVIVPKHFRSALRYLVHQIFFKPEAL